MKQMQALEEDYINLAKTGQDDWFLNLLFDQEYLRIYDRPKFRSTLGYYYMNGCCLPGEKLFVQPDGTLNICEKVTSNEFTIGNIFKGIDYSKIVRCVEDINSLMYENCSQCECFSICSLCYSHCISRKETGILRETCQRIKKRFRHKLEVIQSILESSPDYFEM